MVIFAIIIFALAGVRTLAGIVEAHENEEPTSIKLGSLVVAITYWWCYVWFLTQHVTLN